MKTESKTLVLLTTAVLDIYSFPSSVLHKYSFLRIKIPSVFHEKVWFINILFISSILPYIKKSVRVKFVFKKIKFVFVKNKISVRKDKIRVQKDKIRVPCTASPAIHVVCVYVHAHTHAPACVYFIR